jgi:excisionase family DNA binding protein
MSDQRFPSSQNQLLKFGEVAEHLAVSERTLRRYVQKNLISYIRLSSRQIRFRPAAVELFLNERTIRGGA